MRTLSNITPTPEQIKILVDAELGFRVIRGAAGSGKTTAAILRLTQLCRARISHRHRHNSIEPVRVLVLTFNRTLRGYVMQLIEDSVPVSNQIQLTVETFGRWARTLVGSRHLIDEHDIKTILCSFLEEVGIASVDLDYFFDEINYIMGRFPPDKREQYLKVRRSGRGRAPAVPSALRAKLLTDVIEPYESYKSTNGYVDWRDIALEVATIKGQGYDIVVVDEAQDFSANQLRAIIEHLNDDHATTFIMDTVQRIYPQKFQWLEVDIKMQQHMVYSLTKNHRNTKEIARLANVFVERLESDEFGTLPNAETCQRTYQRPQVVAGLFRAQLDYMLNFIQPFLDSGDSVAILHPKGGQWFKFTKKTLQDRNIGYCELTQKRNWPTGPEQVALSTIHSAKGLEFDHVLLPGLNQEVTPHGNQDGDGTLDALRRLAAMGIGRARNTVVIGYKPGEQSTLINLLDPDTYDLIKV